MYTEKITYTDYDGNERTEKFYFNLNESELIELSFSKKGGYDQWIKRIITEHDNTKIVPMIRNIILSAYGKKSDDGIHFVKNAQISNDFYSSDAYNKLFVKLFTNSDALVKFCNGIIPKNIADKAAANKDEVTKSFMDDFTPDSTPTAVTAEVVDKDEAD